MRVFVCAICVCVCVCVCQKVCKFACLCAQIYTVVYIYFNVCVHMSVSQLECVQDSDMSREKRKIRWRARRTWGERKGNK